MNLFELFVKIGVKDEASKNIEGISSKLSKGLKTAAKIGTAAVGVLGVGVAALGKTMSKNISETAQYADNIDKMSQKMGLSAKAYQEWDFIMQHSGTSMEALKAGMKTLANAVDSGNDAFSRLGITQGQIATLNQEELFAKTIEQLQKVDNETERTYLAGQLLGRGATELGALLNTSAEDTEKMRQQVHELGGVMSDSAVKAGAAFQDSLQNLGVATDSLSRNLSSNFLPSITSMMDGLSALITGDDSGFALIEKGVDDFVKNLNDKLPKFVKTGMKIIESLATSVVENLPILVEKSIPIIEELANGIIKLLPQIIEIGFDIIISLAEGLVDYLPELTTSIVDIILKIVTVLTDQKNLNKLLKAALAIIVELANGLIKNINSIIDATMTLLDGIVDFFLRPANLAMLIETAIEMVLAIGTGIIKAIPQLLVSVGSLIASIFANFATADWSSIGTNLVAGLKKGISNAWANLKSWFKGLFGDLIGVAKKILGIASPSKVFAEIGRFMAEGIGVGWNGAFRDIQRDINDSLDFDGGYIGSFGGGALGGADGYMSRDINIVQNIYSQAKTAAELMREARWQAKMEVLTSV